MSSRIYLLVTLAFYAVGALSVLVHAVTRRRLLDRWNVTASLIGFAAHTAALSQRWNEAETLFKSAIESNARTMMLDGNMRTCCGGEGAATRRSARWRKRSGCQAAIPRCTCSWERCTSSWGISSGLGSKRRQRWRLIASRRPPGPCRARQGVVCLHLRVFSDARLRPDSRGGDFDIEFGITGPNSTNGMSCASGTIAIGDGFRASARGDADVMLAGGAEAPLAPLCYGAFAIIRAMSTRNADPATASRPFDQGRDGFVMAEGTAVLVLEEPSRALARGAPVYAEVLGFGTTNDAHHMTSPRPDGRQVARAMRLALAEARVGPGEVAYVNAHGSSTPLNDSTETLAIRQVFAGSVARKSAANRRA